MNSVTNCISIGDVTAIEDDGKVELIEVKAGKAKSRRLIRQKSILRSAAEILTTGVGMLEGKSIKVESIPVSPRNYLGRLKELLGQSKDNGWSAGLLAPHCYVECVDVNELVHKDSSQPMEEKFKKETQYWSGLGSAATSLDLIAYTPNIVPLSIFPFDDRTCTELMTGTKFFTVYINAEEVFKAFTDTGWTIVSSFEDAVRTTNGEAIAVIKKQGFEAYIPPADFGKLQYELLDPSTLVESFELIRESRAKGGEHGYSVTLFDDEAAQWD